jgi:hypothetical protein
MIVFKDSEDSSASSSDKRMRVLLVDELDTLVTRFS